MKKHIVLLAIASAALWSVSAASVAEAGATSAKDMGKVMKVLMPKVQGKADGALGTRRDLCLVSGGDRNGRQQRHDRGSNARFGHRFGDRRRSHRFGDTHGLASRRRYRVDPAARARGQGVGDPHANGADVRSRRSDCR